MQKQILYLTSPIPPSVNHYLSYRAIMKNGKPMAMSYKTKEAISYQETFAAYVKEQAISQKWIKSENKYQHYYMDCVFYFDRLDKDCNNYFKCLADAITDSCSVWIDDTQLCERVQGICYDYKNPRIELTIKEVDYKGIFTNVSQLDEFESNCIGCKRYKRNCSLLTKAKKGILQDEINAFKCSKYNEIKQ